VVRCVIVDDSASFLNAARTILERGGITVVGVATSTTEAMRGIEELRPDMVLVDVDLGGESGFALAERLHHMPAQPAVIMTSALAEEDLAELVEASPALGFVPKLALSGRAIGDLMRVGTQTTSSVSETPGR
jgi:DNA-binding NarL/FixJ family response regulator